MTQVSTTDLVVRHVRNRRYASTPGAASTLDGFCYVLMRCESPVIRDEASIGGAVSAHDRQRRTDNGLGDDGAICFVPTEYQSLGFTPIDPYVFNPVPETKFLALDLKMR